MPRACATRLARAKAEAALEAVRLNEELRGAYIIAADTVVAVGRRILPKAELLDEAGQCLRLLSGRNHRVHTSVCMVTPNESFRQRLVETRVRFKRLSAEDIEAYLASGEWRGKAGGYAIQGLAGAFVVKIVGSYSNVVGSAALRDAGVAIRRRFPGSFRLAEYLTLRGFAQSRQCASPTGCELTSTAASTQGSLPRTLQEWLVPRWIMMSPAFSSVSPSSRIA